MKRILYSALAFLIFLSLPNFPQFQNTFIAPPSAQAEPSRFEREFIFAVTTHNHLIRFSSLEPGKILSEVSIAGLQPDESILGIDVRPSTGQLYALGSTNRLYIVNPATGMTTPVTAEALATTGNEMGFDFNPVRDQLQMFDSANQFLGLDPSNGSRASAGVPLAFASSDRHRNSALQPAAVAYTSSFAGAVVSSMYGIDPTLDIVFRQSSLESSADVPNSGQLLTVGRLGLDAGGLIGFDIGESNATGYASFLSPGDTKPSLYHINLQNGHASYIGEIGGTEPVRDVAVGQHLTIFATNEANQLLSFLNTNPGEILSRVPITGLQAGERVLGIDFRPATGQLFGLGSTSRIYTINPTTGQATQVGTQPLTPLLEGEFFGFDFNPVVDRIRITGSDTQNLRVVPDTAVVAAVDGALAFAEGDVNTLKPRIVGSAYTNNVPGTTSTMLYGIAANLNCLVLQNPPNDGKLTTVGDLGFNIGDNVGFDIAPVDGTAYASMIVSDCIFGTDLFSINLATGVATEIGLIGFNESITGLAIGSSSATNMTTSVVINMSDAGDPVKAGENITYNIVVDNNGSEPVFNVTVKDVVPAALTYVSSSASQGTATLATENGMPTVTFNFGAIPAKGKVTATMVAKTPLFIFGTVYNSVTIVTGTGQPNRFNTASVDTLLVF